MTGSTIVADPGRLDRIVLVARSMTKRVGHGASKVTPVDGIDLTLRCGELVALGGPSGSGKSTLLHLLTGFDRCDGGSVDWIGVRAGAQPAWAVVAIVAQSLALLPELSMGENVMTPMLLAGWDHAAAIERSFAVMTELDVAHLRQRRPAETSLGQQQRVAVARAIVIEPSILLADEPTSHQDEAHGEVVLRAIRRCVDAGSAVVIAGHDHRLGEIADRRLTLADGRLVEFGDDLAGSSIPEDLNSPEL